MGGMRRLPKIVIGIMAGVCALSCAPERKSFVASLDDPEVIPTMTTRNVETFISDSGYTRYHITTALWEMYDEASEPFWRFPQGLELQQYDEMLRPAASVTCDSARYYSRKRLWRLDGHVLMVNTLRDSFITSQLYWDQFQQKVYSDSFIHIVRSDRIIEGYGFNSNQTMTAYTVNRPTGIIPIERPVGEGAAADTAAADSVATRGRRPAPRSASQRAIDAGDARAANPAMPVRPARTNNPNHRPLTPLKSR